MRKEPERREGDEFAGLRRHGEIEIGKDGFAAQRRVQIDDRRHEPSGGRLSHDVDMRFEGILSARLVSLQA